jgi:hypothetical protein
MGLTLTEIFTILIIHFISDFVLQTDKQAKGKSKNWNDLLSHTATYSAIWVVPISILLAINKVPFPVNSIGNSLFFVAITFICHTITDYFTSRLNSRLWAEGKVHNFFVSVGADQVYHYIQLFLTYYYLKTL